MEFRIAAFAKALEHFGIVNLLAAVTLMAGALR